MHAISKEHLSLERVKEIIDHKEHLTLSQEAKENKAAKANRTI